MLEILLSIWLSVSAFVYGPAPEWRAPIHEPPRGQPEIIIEP